MVFFFFFFKQKTAYEMRSSDWSSDVCSSDLLKRSSDAFSERVQQISAKLQLVGRQLADLEAKERTLEDALRRRQLLPANLPFGTPFMDPEIGRASCRERVCQYV